MTVQIVPRAEWGARAPKTTPKQLVSFDSGWFIHWLGTPANRSLSDGAVLRSTQLFHQQAKGWNDIAYSFAIGREHPDRVHELRGWGIQGGHTEGHNSRSMAVVFLIGEGERPTERMLATCRQFLAQGDGRTIYRGATIRPHNAVRVTACPGPELTAWIKAGMPITPGEPTMPTPPKPPTTENPYPAETAEALVLLAQHAGYVGDRRWFGPDALAALHRLKNRMEHFERAANEATTDVRDLRATNATSSATIVRLTSDQDIAAKLAAARLLALNGATVELEKARKANGTAALAQLIATVGGALAEARKGMS